MYPANKCISVLSSLPNPLSVENNGSANLVGGLTSGGLVETGGVDGNTSGRLDTGSESLGVTKGEDTGVVDLGLDKGSVVLCM